MLNFSDQTRTGAFNVVWPLPREDAKIGRLEMQCWVSQQVRFLGPDQDFSARGIQTRSFGAGWADFVLEFFKMIHLYTGGQFLLPQRANNGKREILPTSNIGYSGGFQCLGPSNWIICSPLSPFCSEQFSTFSLSYWGAHSYYPRGGKGNSPNSQYG